MVKFDIVYDGDLGQIMHEFWLFIEIRGVVLVALDDKMIAAGHAKARPKILHNTTDQKRRIKPADFADPRRDARRRRLAVRPGDNHRAPPAYKLFPHDLGL